MGPDEDIAVNIGHLQRIASASVMLNMQGFLRHTPVVLAVGALSVGGRYTQVRAEGREAARSPARSTPTPTTPTSASSRLVPSPATMDALVKDLRLTLAEDQVETGAGECSQRGKPWNSYVCVCVCVCVCVPLPCVSVSLPSSY